MSGEHTNPAFPAPIRPRPLGRVHGVSRFGRLQRSSVRARSGPLKVSWSPRPGGPDAGLCVAYAIPTSVGNAVQRNTVRRRLRAAFSLHAVTIPTGDVLVRVAAPCESCTWTELAASVADVSNRLARHIAGSGGQP